MASHDIVGSLGVALILGAYVLLQAGRLTVRDVRYSALNALGAGLVLFSLCFEFNVSAFVVEAFWLVISVVGMVTSWRRSRP